MLTSPAVDFPAPPIPRVASDELDRLLQSLDLTADILRTVRLPACRVAAGLVVAQTDRDGRTHCLTPGAERAWRAMRTAAERDGIVLVIVSAFRSLEEQAEIIRDKLAQGMPMAHILVRTAPPGHSEHHSGNAVDINTPGCVEREEPFEQTAAFRWLCRHAGAFGFHLSYPRGNPWAFLYEPWHWCFHGGPAGAECSAGESSCV